MPPRLTPAACLAAALLAAGCGTIEDDKRTNALEASVSGYGSALRWGFYETAWGYVHPDKRGDLPEHLKNIRVTSYEVVQPPVMPDENTATQIAHVEYLHDDRQVVKRLSDRQLWKYDAAVKTWWLQSGLPAFP